MRPIDYLCEGDVCPIVEGGNPVFKDAMHLRPKYVRKRATFVDRVISVN
jgi:hypothetical protein